ncbi:MAG: hypothetical protein PVJ02_07815 [Gemmatimonadota bacterium]|jgi:hypothetical protein
MQILHMSFCEHAQLRPDGKLDIHGAFYDLAAPGFPAKQDEMVLAVVIEWAPGDGGRYQFRVELRGEVDQPSFTVEGQTEVKPYEPGERPQRTFLVMPLKDIVFPEPGPYRLTVRVKGETVTGPTLHLWEVEDEDAA